MKRIQHHRARSASVAQTSLLLCAVCTTLFYLTRARPSVSAYNSFHPLSCLLSCLYFTSSFLARPALLFFFFFLNNPAPPEISPLPLHDPLPIYPERRQPRQGHHARRRQKRRPRPRGVVRPADRLGAQCPSERPQRLRRTERRPLLVGRGEIGRAHV